MSRRARYIAIALACSVLMVASSQAGPTKALPRESALALESMASAWEWFVALLRTAPPAAPRLESTTAADGVSLDPNGGQH